VIEIMKKQIVDLVLRLLVGFNALPVKQFLAKNRISMLQHSPINAISRSMRLFANPKIKNYIKRDTF
jgi:hypothetical protein